MKQNLTGRAAAAAASMGQRAAAAGVGLCHGCRHPVRLHGAVGCSTGECWCNATGAELRSGAPVEASPAAAPSAAELALLDVRCKCTHRRTEHNLAGSHVVCSACACRGFKVPVDELEVPDAPAAPPAEPTPPPVAAPAPAAPPTAAPEPVREQPAPRPVTEPLPPKWSQPAVTHPIREAWNAAAPKRLPRLNTARPARTPSALGSAAVLGEPDAGREVAAAGPGATGEAAATLPAWDPPKLPAPRSSPSPFDFEPFLARALYVSARWYCERCHQWPLNPGACAGCHKPLQAVYTATIPRETS